MTNNTTAPSWEYTEDAFKFQHEAPPRRLRAWDRAPKSPHLARHKGRKVWKRPDIRLLDNGEKLESSDVSERRDPLGDVSANVQRSIKRLRLKDAENNEHEDESQSIGHVKYLATLRDGAAGTPKRKHVARIDPTVTKNLPCQGLNVPSCKRIFEAEQVDVEEDTIEALAAPASKCAIDLLRVSIVDEKEDSKDLHPEKCAPNAETRQNMQASVEPVRTESAFEAITSYDSIAERDTNSISKDPDILDVAIVQIPTRETDTPKSPAPLDPLLEQEAVNPSALQAEVLGKVYETNSTDNRERALSAVHIAPDEKPVCTELGPLLRTPRPKYPSRKARATPGLVNQIDGIETPQIGVTLLRRESLRSRASPSKKASASKLKSPRKKQGLKKRDTLQEREILQQFNEAENQCQVIANQDVLDPESNASPSRYEPAHSNVSISDTLQVGKVPTPDIGLSGYTEADISQQENGLDIQETLESGAHTQTLPSVDAIPESSDSEQIRDAAQPEVDGPPHKGKQEALETGHGQGMQRIMSAGPSVEEHTRTTRSAARFSDDASMLKDFLNRAQAKKAAKDIPVLIARSSVIEASSPRRSPRKEVNRPASAAPLTPQKAVKIKSQQLTPPQKPAPDIDSDEADEIVTEPTSQRRSARTRLPGPSKTAPSAPSFIPVRRGEGTEPVVLQKSQAQEVAIVTRANTRRNKGQSKPPLLALLDLPADEDQMAQTAKQRIDHAKSVAWAANLASYQESKVPPTEGAEDQRVKVKRVRGLGPVNGTPAKKSAAVVPATNGTPAPKRRSKKA